MSDEVCGHPTDSGTCGVSFGICEECGKCFTHCPHREEERRAARSRGAQATNAARKEENPSGLLPGELPSLDGYDAAKLWLERIGRAVATNRLGPREAQAAIRAVQSWLNAEAEQVTREELDELRDAVERLQGEVGDGKLEVLT